MYEKYTFAEMSKKTLEVRIDIVRDEDFLRKLASNG